MSKDKLEERLRLKDRKTDSQFRLTFLDDCTKSCHSLSLSSSFVNRDNIDAPQGDGTSSLSQYL